ncbi:polysaccharide lyase family 1 protein [Pleomassaria siparia CBS 279.74]|uniref:Polysaccharide lyase family 1 protein n=1 Tax=Pleomassaria siparia CBS 279.74 TaxID=1314801 RepID=A0A6G1JRS6_9PLEO|nr:polysaccharide lyase family 1 protein [Pleomassaria siparia CBS 279.74]
METHGFLPSLKHIENVTEDPGVKKQLRMGGFEAKVFMGTGIKAAYNIIMTRSDNKEQERSGIHLKYWDKICKIPPRLSCICIGFFIMRSIQMLGLLASLTSAAYNGPAPALPDRQPFGFGASVTGGGTPTNETTYLVENMMDLRTALKLTTPRTIYVKGEIKGNQVNETKSGDCQYYIDSSGVPNYNFTLYLMAMNTTYTSAVKAAAAAGEEFEGRNATDYLALLNRQNGWRGTAQNVQKSTQTIDAQGNVTLIGWDADAYLNGVGLVFNSRSNIIIRNLRISPPRDCFPAPETYPSSWNARYDAIAFVTTTNAWLDGNIIYDGPTAVAPDPFLWGWKVDRYDGLFDVEDGSDDITFSHNIVANHHKSLLWGGGEKEASRDIGKMKFTVFGNHFVNSMSRNPLMRFGTFYMVNNVFSNYNNKAPLFVSSTTNTKREVVGRGMEERADVAYTPDFGYNMGIYNMSSVLVSGNYFDQSGAYSNDTTRIFTFSDLATPDWPATFCSPADMNLGNVSSTLAAFQSPKNSFNGEDVDLLQNVQDGFKYYVSKKTDSVAGGLAVDCGAFEAQEMPRVFAGSGEVLVYVQGNAGQVGKSEL